MKMGDSTDIIKTVIVLQGSPRKKGNSTILAKEIAKGAEAAGARHRRTLYSRHEYKAMPGLLGLPEKGQQGLRHRR